MCFLKKISNPFNKKFAIGAVSLESIIVDKHPDIPKEYIKKESVRLKELLREKHKLYKSNRKPIAVDGKNVIIVDDGIATGNNLLVSIAMLRKENPAKIIVAVPILLCDDLKKFEQNTAEFI
ncbi:MAG: putative phosphoribosyl transferase [Flavobacterium sp.]